jgi:hypothetical protein
MLFESENIFQFWKMLFQLLKLSMTLKNFILKNLRKYLNFKFYV